MYREGFRREVKDGLNTKILSYPWVKGLNAGKPVLKTEVNSLPCVWVNELMTGDGRAWNRELIQNLFTEASCKAILEIKGLDPAARDKWVWTSDVKGMFSVSSAYAVAVKKKILSLDMPGCSSNINADKKARMRCWNLRVKGKIKHFIWRCFTDCLPVSANLRIRGMQLDNVCQCCGESVETVGHVMFTCSRAAMVWSLVPGPNL
ncbi:RNA-directed DNA polymerase (reversetranscriptase)-related family protein [Striga asiatica]|uniref:RNA-directed DNA polymerase (Reversetranscriptase)-related family protein n=1 Tax=Striga asiatica TaxID=4170 RepID=A0A5A7QVV0_STRAF|nr:RNA-directed DNA polymerase (reversetranscriptase)-related family protein [Striga asiatica]